MEDRHMTLDHMVAAYFDSQELRPDLKQTQQLEELLKKELRLMIKPGQYAGKTKFINPFHPDNANHFPLQGEFTAWRDRPRA